MIVKHYRIADGAPGVLWRRVVVLKGAVLAGRSLREFAYITEFCSTGMGFTQGQGC